MWEGVERWFDVEMAEAVGASGCNPKMVRARRRWVKKVIDISRMNCLRKLILGLFDFFLFILQFVNSNPMFGKLSHPSHFIPYYSKPFNFLILQIISFFFNHFF